MICFRRLCVSVKSGLFVGAPKCYKRGFCHKVNDLSEFIKTDAVQKYFDKLHSSEDVVKGDLKYFIDRILEERKEALSNIQSLFDLKNSSKDDGDFQKMLDEEKKDLDSKLNEIEYRLLKALVPQPPDSNEIIVEINAGVGGKEAMLFAGELRSMYLGYIDYRRWNLTSEDLEPADIGGIRHSTLFIEGQGVFRRLWHESGVHRVQRVPATEKNGRIHTSTVTVAVFPQPQEIDVDLDEKDLVIETKRSSGAGGQHVNKTESAVRITHIPTGIAVECQTDRSQIKNRQVAYQKLCAKLFALQQKDQISGIQHSRKMQVGTSARSDKIRTYNFPQDRITDHRISKHLHNMSGFLQGEQDLDALLDELIIFSEKERLESFILSLSEKGEMTS